MPDSSPGESFDEIPKELYGSFVTEQLLETVFLVDPKKLLKDRIHRLRLAIRQRFHQMWKFWKIQHRGTIPLKTFVERKYKHALISGVALCFMNTNRYYEVLESAEFNTFIEFVVLEETTELDPFLYEQAENYPVHARYANVLDKHPHLEGRARIASLIDASMYPQHATPPVPIANTEEKVETTELPTVLDPRESLQSEYADEQEYEPVVIPMPEQPPEPDFPVLRPEGGSYADALNPIRVNLIQDISTIIQEEGKISFERFSRLVCGRHLDAQCAIGSLTIVHGAVIPPLAVNLEELDQYLREKDFYFSLWRNYFLPACPQNASIEPD